MTDQSPHPDVGEERVNATLAEYLLAMDAGEAPDREDWIAQHPDFADELEEFLLGTEQFERLGESLHASMAAASRVRARQEPEEPDLTATLPVGETPNGDQPPAPWPTAVQTAVPGRFTPGTVLLDRYHVVSQVGKGGMGEVYRAYDVVLGDFVALKFLPSKAGLKPAIMERFFSEVRLARRVNHENVCGVYDIGDLDGEPFISMEYVDGEDLASLLRRVGRLPVEKALSVTEQLCAGLSAAHERGVLHRDLKPANVMLDKQGHVRIMDFGLAVLEMQADMRDEVAGTPTYMAPEQWTGGDLSARTDLYALGSILYEVFTGEKAHPLRSIPGTTRPLVPPSSHFPGIHPMIDRAIIKCLEDDPDNRPASASAVMQELPPRDDAVWREPLPPGDERPERRIARRWKWASLCLAAMLLVSVAGSVYLLQHRLPSPLTWEIIDLLVGLEDTDHGGADEWCAFWYAEDTKGECSLYGQPEPVMIQGNRDLLIGKAYNTMRVEGFREKSGAQLREALLEREYLLLLHTQGAGRFAGLYTAPRDDREQLIGSFLLTMKNSSERGFRYLSGPWHGYVEEEDPKTGEPRRRNAAGKVILVRCENLNDFDNLQECFEAEGLDVPDKEDIEEVLEVIKCLSGEVE